MKPTTPTARLRLLGHLFISVMGIFFLSGRNVDKKTVENDPEAKPNILFLIADETKISF
ncbi:hypothetical protein ACEZ3G_06495 [Maribacter algicola]|uniref:Uncharacterized protein n=1 Tax=Meishania litoralis TaxID=3434685 RepID=A0ACC7LHA7_9FLAO